MGIFKKKQDRLLQAKVIEILTRSISRKRGGGITFNTSDEEDLFFRNLVKATIDAKLNPDNFYFEPMSNKSFSIHYLSYPVGKIKLQGKKTWMQILKGLYGVKVVEEPSVGDYINHISEWISYIKYCLRG